MVTGTTRWPRFAFVSWSGVDHWSLCFSSESHLVQRTGWGFAFSLYFPYAIHAEFSLSNR